MSDRDDLADDVEVVVAAGAELGEGPFWDVRSARLVWVDIVGRSILLTDTRTGHTDTIDVPLDVGSVVPRDDGGFVAALRDGFWVVDDGPPRRVHQVSGTGAGVRFNDGKCDPAGRFWAGTMAEDFAAGAAALYRLDPSGVVTKMLDDVTVSNGLAWSGDGRTMYYIDTPTRRIDAFTFSPATGAISDRRTVIEVPRELGHPDGMTIDAAGGLWVALWDGHAVHRYVEGRLDRVVELPVARPTSCAFGGPSFGELYVTSASTGLSADERTAQPLAGALFRIHTEVGGVAPFTYGTA
jgi:sugar lactone lactonase YvrE